MHACHLKNLTIEGLAQYIEHRLESAGYFGPRLFSDSTIKTLFKKTKGVPRLINLLCNKALMICYASGEFYVSEKHIQMAARDSKQVNRVVMKKSDLVGNAGVLAAISFSLSQVFPPVS